MGYWIVVVDDEPLCLKIAKEHLNNIGMRVSCLRSGGELLRFMEKNSPDLILLDILMPEMDGFETYRELRKREDRDGKIRTPVIFLTGENSKAAERRGLRAGASDFIHKPFDKDILIKRVNNTIINSKMIESLTEEVSLDKLTGFYNKASGTEKIEELCKKETGALLVLDLDNFKLVNDIFGHDMGDRILVAFSEAMKQNVRAGDVVCRIGGDEFTAYLLNLTRKEGIASFSDRLNDQFLAKAEELMGSGHGLPIGVSTGCAFAPKHGNEYHALFQLADSALYKVKLNGRHGYAIYDMDSDTEGEEQDLEQDISRVIQTVSERSGETGAMLLGQEAFSWNYRFIVRFLERYGSFANRLLFRLSSKERGMVFDEIAAQFGDVMKRTLRKSDIIFQYRTNEFFVVLPQLQPGDTQETINRVLKEWENLGYRDRVRIEYTSSLLSFADGGIQEKNETGELKGDI